MEDRLQAIQVWLDRELKEGDIRVLVSLADCDSTSARAASKRVAQSRLELTARDTAAVYSTLRIKPHMPPALVAETVLSFVDGAACRHALGAMPDVRAAFDVLWLALLAVAE